jgi:hypothetical protein
MPDEYRMPPAERAAYANGWHARDDEVTRLKREIVELRKRKADCSSPARRWDDKLKMYVYPD